MNTWVLAVSHCVPTVKWKVYAFAQLQREPHRQQPGVYQACTTGGQKCKCQRFWPEVNLAAVPYKVYQRQQQAMQVHDISQIHKDSFERSMVCLMLLRIHSSIMLCQKSN